jgi:hypothetical protein
VGHLAKASPQRTQRKSKSPPSFAESAKEGWGTRGGAPGAPQKQVTHPRFARVRNDREKGDNGEER